MSHQKSFARLRTVATMLLLCLFANVVKAQVQTPRYISPTPNCGGFYEYLPQGYNSNETYPLIVFVHGLGELGQGTAGELPRILWNGLPKLINQGQFPTSFSVNGQTHKFIVISPQFKQWPGATDVNDVVNYAIQNYRVNTNRIYVTGLSMGGGVTWEYGAMFASRVAAIVPICGATYPDNGRAQQIASNGVAVWATHNNADGTVPVSNTDTYVMYVNNNNPNPAAKKSIWLSASHDAWTQTYNPNYRENNLNIYEWMLQYSKGGSTPPPPPPPPAPTTVNLPGRVEAENFSNRSGVQTEATGDAAGGGQNVGWIDNGDWMDYLVNPTSSGSYTVKLRVATPNNGGQLQIRKADGTTLATVTVPNTGGYQTYQTVTATVSLTAGTQTLKVVSTATPGWNFNWMEFELAPVAAPLPSATIFKIEAENFTSQSGVQTEGTQDAGGGQNVGWIEQNDWMDYSINPATSGTYTVKLRVATPNANAQLQIRKADGTVLTTVTLPNTWGYQSWQTVNATINLTAGAQTIRVVSTASEGWNINWMEFSPSAGAAAPPPASGTATKIEAEAFSSQSGIQTEWTQDAGGGQNVGWIDNGDWMDYSYNAPSTGTYTIKFRIATPNNGAQLQIRKSDGTVLSTVNITNTGAYQIWQTITATVNLTQGQQTLRILSSTSQGWNFNWMEITPGGSSTPVVVTATKTKIEAEAFSSQNGVQTEGTQDAGGGQNVGWIDQNDWMDYSYNAPGTGTYNISFRIATPNNGAQLQIRKADGTVLGTVNIPNTNAYQIWQTVTTSVSLSQGQQTLRIVSTAPAGWNINWMEIEGPVSGTVAGRTATGETEIVSTTTSTAAPLEIYPNPVTDRFVLKLNNDLKGAVKVSIVNNAGSVVKEFSLNKASEGISQFYLSIGTLPAGSYILKAQMGNWSETKQIIKQ
jgi:poly(3-hydroxybutyrate) depolymerase